MCVANDLGLLIVAGKRAVESDKEVAVIEELRMEGDAVSDAVDVDQHIELLDAVIVLDAEDASTAAPGPVLLDEQ